MDFPNIFQRDSNPNQRLASVCLIFFAKYPQAWYMWQLTSIHSIVSPRHLQAQYKQLPSTDHIVAPTRWAWTGCRQQLTLACNQSSPTTDPRTDTLMTSFRPHQGTTQIAPQMTNPKGGLSRHQSPPKANPTPWSKPLHNSSSAVLMARPQVSQPEDQFHPVACQ